MIVRISLNSLLNNIKLYIKYQIYLNFDPAAQVFNNFRKFKAVLLQAICYRLKYQVLPPDILLRENWILLVF